ncbi:hypothetical protein BH09PLA1_BH09PLA1_30680 [soil metagenome]
MRELEFLPSWYPQARRRQRWLRLQACATAALLCGLGLWFGLALRNVNSAKAGLATVDAQLAQSQLEVEQLQVQLKLKGQLEFQRQIVSRLGLQVEMSRMINTLEQVMPKEMSLSELSFDTEEQLKRGEGGASGGASGGSNKDQAKTRVLKVRLLAVAPSDVDLANFLAGLTNVPFFQDVAMTTSHDKSEGGHIMREFEVTFAMNLDTPAESN